ncbi:MAG: hypothetical protein JNM62_11555 [Flavobacteriales bacterium]|nr:hypothetical protein [Flavobacteriales bacterium]
MTTAKKYVSRSKNNSTLHRLLDQRTRAVLHAISSEPKGKALDAYLRTLVPHGT